ncbi:MAG TPA: hypothetical protein VIJ59_06940 [Caulobacteraceae bacterium]
MHSDAPWRWIAGRALALFAVAALTPTIASACACGCGVFDVGDATLIPGGAGAGAWLEYDYLDQTRNWSGAGRAPAANNTDIRIITDFATLGGQYMWKSGWGVMAEIPLAARSFTTDQNGPFQTIRHGGVGDIRLMGIYSGFSPSMATGMTFGLKLPTGSFNDAGYDRDIQIGSGTTDLILGGYHTGGIGKDAAWTWFAQGRWDVPLNSRAGYRPGDEADAAIGVAWSASQPTAKVSVTPMLQLIASDRARDTGPAANPANTGYERLLVAPGVELKAANWKLYGDVELPLYQRVNGNQLVSPALFKVVLSRSF